MVLDDRPAQAKRLFQGKLLRQDYRVIPKFGRDCAVARRDDWSRVGCGRLLAHSVQAGPEPANGPGLPRGKVRQGEHAPYCGAEQTD